MKTTGKRLEIKKAALKAALNFGDPAGARTQDPNIKSVMLYQLSYGIFPFFKVAQR